VWVLLASTLGSLVGAWAFYGIGARLGLERSIALLARVPLLDREDLEGASAWCTAADRCSSDGSSPECEASSSPDYSAYEPYDSRRALPRPHPHPDSSDDATDRTLHPVQDTSTPMPRHASVSHRLRDGVLVAGDRGRRLQ